MCFDLSGLLVRTRYKMPDGSRRDMWAIEITKETGVKVNNASTLPDACTLRVPMMFFCPWCGDPLPRGTVVE